MCDNQQNPHLSVGVSLFTGSDQNIRAELMTEHSNVIETSVHRLGSVYCGFVFVFFRLLKVVSLSDVLIHLQLSDPKGPFSSHVHHLFLDHIIK